MPRAFQGTRRFYGVADLPRLQLLLTTKGCRLTSCSKRAFQKRFREWGFPSKHVPAPSDAALLERIRVLWELNTSHKQMYLTLNAEGFQVNERQLSKIRQKNHLWIRENRKSSNVVPEGTTDDTVEGVPEDEVIGHKRPRHGVEDTSGVPSEVIAKRRERHEKLMAESEERLKSRTRRRRTRGWAGLPPDEGMDPRFPSELTLAEALVELNLDRILYKDVRRDFEQICRSQNLEKKTICGPERWSDAKQLLVSRFPQLQTIFWGPDAAYLSQTRKPMALDVICMDVTKRLRTAGNHITIADAKNTLGLTPQEARDARAAFDAILKADFFTGKLESTKDHWEELKSRWIKGSTRLRLALSMGEADPAYAGKVRAIEAIARDVQKRNRDNQTRYLFPRDNSVSSRPHPPTELRPVATNFPKRPGMGSRPKKQAAQKASNESPGLANASLDADEDAPPLNPIATLASQALASAPMQLSEKDYTGMQIDPSLLEAAALPTQQQAESRENDDFLAQLSSVSLPEPTQKSVYFRLSPTSIQRFPTMPKIWLDTLPVGRCDLENLRTLAMKRSGLGGMANVQRVEGLAPGEGGERWAIDEDDELEAYLAMIGSGKATFVVELARQDALAE